MKVERDLSCQVGRKRNNRGCNESNLDSNYNEIYGQNISDQIFLHDLIQELIKMANEKNIKLQMFFQELERYKTSKNDFERNAFITATKNLQNLILVDEIPVLMKNSYQTSLGKSYISKGEKGFDHFYSYVEVIYEIHCLFDMGTESDSYIGHTEKELSQRFEYEIQKAIDYYLELGEFPSRLIEQAILKAIEMEVILVGINVLGVKNKKFNDLYHFLKLYSTLRGQIKFNIRKRLANTLLYKYFETDILEKHYTKMYVCDREKWYKQNYPTSNGTIYPYGLNMSSNIESVKKYVALPLYDIAFMLSLGYRVPRISNILKKLYGIKEASEDNVYARITQFFGGIESAEIILLKPVIQALLKNHPDLSGNQIGKLIHRKGGKQFFDSEECPFKRWFGDIKLRELKKLITQKDFSWNKIDCLLEELRKGNCIKGIHKSEWIELFIKGASNEELAKIGGYKSSDSFRKHFFTLNESIKAFGVSNRKEAIKKYRKLKTIEILENTISPSLLTLENIYSNTFGFQSRQEYINKYKQHYNSGDFFFKRALRNYFKGLFEGISLENIIKYYS
ncbi:MAG: hypothetical protein ACFFC3_03325 [Candidatus Odinarchaeota archaeon]